MSKFKDHAIRCADYVLSQDCEREAEFDSLDEWIKDCKNSYEVLTRKDMRDHVMNSTWYSALVVRDGKREANKEVTELINEVLSGN